VSRRRGGNAIEPNHVNHVDAMSYQIPPNYYSNQGPPTSNNSNTPLQFYSGPATTATTGGVGGGASQNYYGHVEAVGTMGMGNSGNLNAGTSGSFGGNIVVTGPWWSAFGPGGVEGELPLLEG
jgi:protein YIPF5/7